VSPESKAMIWEGDKGAGGGGRRGRGSGQAVMLRLLRAWPPTCMVQTCIASMEPGLSVGLQHHKAYGAP
jgi:hypothetical protein